MTQPDRVFLDAAMRHFAQGELNNTVIFCAEITKPGRAEPEAAAFLNLLGEVLQALARYRTELQAAGRGGTSAERANAQGEVKRALIVYLQQHGFAVEVIGKVMGLSVRAVQAHIRIIESTATQERAKWH